MMAAMSIHAFILGGSCDHDGTADWEIKAIGRRYKELSPGHPTFNEPGAPGVEPGGERIDKPTDRREAGDQSAHC